MSAKLQAIDDEVWAIQPAVLRQIRAYLAGDTSVRAALARTPSQPKTQGVIGVIPIEGVIERRSSLLSELFGGTSVEAIRASLRGALADPDVRGIVLSIDSPGGGVAGVTELAEEIRAAREQKPIVAIADTLAGSCAYWIGSQASQFLATRSGQVGSIGVYGVHFDISRALEAEGVTPTIISAGEHKVDETEFAPLSEDARADIQARVDASYEMFVSDVAKGRGVPVETVRADFGGGRVVLANDALRSGMIDGIDTIDGAFRQVSRVARTLHAAAEIVDDEPEPFRQRVAHLKADAESVVEHAQVRAELRAKEGRPPLSEPIESALRSTRDAISALLADDPPVAPPAVDPPPAVPAPAPAVATTPRFRSQDEWLHFLTERTPVQ